MGYLKRLNRDQRGLTAIELAVVVAILAVLAAIVAGNTTGMSTGARGATKSTDVAEVQKAVLAYSGQHPNSYYPILDPSTTFTVGTASTVSATMIFTAATTFTTPEGISKQFVPNFLQANPKHGSDSTPSWYVYANGRVTNTLADGSY